MLQLKTPVARQQEPPQPVDAGRAWHQTWSQAARRVTIAGSRGGGRADASA